MTAPKLNDPSLSYTAASARVKVERPASVSALAFLGIVVGATLLFCNTTYTVIEGRMLAHPDMSLIKDVPPLDPLVVKIGAANAIAGIIFAALLLGGCLAALGLRPWARRLLLIWSAGFILLGIARTLGEINYAGPATLAWIQRNSPKDPTFASGQMAAMLVPKAIAFLSLYFILPILFFGLWTRPEVRDAFERKNNWG